MQKVQNGNYFRPMRPTLKTLLLMESKQLLCVEFLSTAATHIDLRMRVGLRKMVKDVPNIDIRKLTQPLPILEIVFCLSSVDLA